MKKIIIAIDGYSACGKSTTAKMVAARLGYIYIDTGAMYRAVTLYFLENHVSLTNPKAVSQALADIRIKFVRNERTGTNEVCLNGLNVEEEIRKMYVSDQVSEVSTLAEVRHALVEQQQRMGRKRGVVMDGRDIGTKVFPEAELKIFMTCDILVRANRRQQELADRGQEVELEEIMENLQTRDRIDTTRKESPLVKAEDAFPLDTTYMSFDEQTEYVLNLATSHIVELPGSRTSPQSS